MRLLYLAYARLPTEKAHGVQIMKTCEALAQRGAEVELVVPGRKTPFTGDPFPHYDTKQVFTLSVARAPDMVDFGAVGFLFGALWFSEAARSLKSFKNADVVYSRDAFLLLQYLLFRKRLIYEAHTKPTLISKIVARRVAGVVAISDALREEYIQAGVPKDRTATVHDAVDLTSFTKQYDKKQVRRKFNVPTDRTIALYVGRFDKPKGVPTCVLTSTLLPDTIHMVLVGSGPLTITPHASLQVIPPTPYRDLPEVLSMADVLILPNSLYDEDASRYTSPLKAFAYMASGIPVVVSDVPALRELFDDSTATFFKPDDHISLKDNLVAVVSSYDEAQKKAACAKERAKTYTWDARAHAILTFIHEAR